MTKAETLNNHKQLKTNLYTEFIRVNTREISAVKCRIIVTSFQLKPISCYKTFHLQLTRFTFLWIIDSKNFLFDKDSRSFTQYKFE